MSFREFLQSSTIHGLSHITSSTRLIRAIWIVIVLLGFTIAGFLIWQSFDNWQHDPIDTTISTHPIEQVTFPKIYVCPPKHTYTNLNHDVINNKNVTLTEDQIDDLKILIDKQIEEVKLEEIMFEVTKVKEENKFINWYMGISQLNIPYYNKISTNGYEYQEQVITLVREGIVKKSF